MPKTRTARGQAGHPGNRNDNTQSKAGISIRQPRRSGPQFQSSNHSAWRGDVRISLQSLQRLLQLDARDVQVYLRLLSMRRWSATILPHRNQVAALRRGDAVLSRRGIATSAGLTPSQVRRSVERLVRVGLLKIRTDVWPASWPAHYNPPTVVSVITAVVADGSDEANANSGPPLGPIRIEEGEGERKPLTESQSRVRRILTAFGDNPPDAGLVARWISRLGGGEDGTARVEDLADQSRSKRDRIAWISACVRNESERRAKAAAIVATARKWESGDTLTAAGVVS